MRSLSGALVIVFGVAAAGAGAFGAGCGRATGPDRGGLMLMIGQDGPLALDTLRIDVATSAGVTLRHSELRIPAETELPTTLAIASNGDPTAAVRIAVSGLRAGVAIDRRDNLVEQVPVDRVAALPIVLSARCTAQVETVAGEARSRCAAEETCDPSTGACVSSHIDGSRLGTYAPGQESSIGVAVVPTETDAGTTSGACGATEKRCGTQCVSTRDPAFGCAAAACGPCSVDPNAIFSCDASAACALAACATGYKPCGGRCVAVSDPTYGCGATSCDATSCPDPGTSTLVCQSGACVVGACIPGTKQCGNKCVPTDRNNGCESASCATCGTTETCQGTPSACACVADNLTPCTGKACGSAINNCGATIGCPDTCPGQGLVCMAGDAGSACGCTLATTCSGLACGPVLDKCGQVVVCPNTCTGKDACGVGGPTACGAPPSCANATAGALGLASCGPSGTDDCCATSLVAGGAFFRQDSVSNPTPGYPATVPSFRLDKYEVTVARYRQFFAAWTGGYRPADGAGKHLHLKAQGVPVGGGQIETGWQSGWNAQVGAPPTTCDTGLGTWSTSVDAAREPLPLTCVSWYEAAAFCIWDGGFLPTVTEWNYAAAGGDARRDYPWGGGGPTNFLATYCAAGGGQCAPTTTLPAKPGFSTSSGAGRYGQLDLAGNVAEWTFGEPDTGAASGCDDCVLASGGHDIRGGGYEDDAANIHTYNRSPEGPTSRHPTLGFRCARLP